ncbi:unnamed protein product, partial [marine sediment metagenome]
IGGDLVQALFAPFNALGRGAEKVIRKISSFGK